MSTHRSSVTSSAIPARDEGAIASAPAPSSTRGIRGAWNGSFSHQRNYRLKAIAAGMCCQCCVRPRGETKRCEGCRTKHNARAALARLIADSPSTGPRGKLIGYALRYIDRATSAASFSPPFRHERDARGWMLAERDRLHGYDVSLVAQHAVAL